jgi:hypothetical protein
MPFSHGLNGIFICALATADTCRIRRHATRRYFFQIRIQDG